MTFPRPFEALPSGCVACFKMLPRGERVAEPPALNFEKFDLTYEGERWRASRLSFYLNKHPIPRAPPRGGDQFVLHTCDNDWCINHDHLYLGTIQQNTKDKFERHPTIRQILSKSASWKGRSEESKAASLSGLYGQPGKPSYERSQESRARSANSKRRDWNSLTPEKRAERGRKIAEGIRRARARYVDEPT